MHRAYPIRPAGGDGLSPAPSFLLAPSGNSIVVSLHKENVIDPSFFFFVSQCEICRNLFLLVRSGSCWP